MHIKNETRVERNPENTVDARCPVADSNTNSSASIIEEKNRLLDILTHLKAENQQLTFHLKKTSDDCISLKSENEKLVQNTTTMTAEMNSLKCNLSQAKSESVKKDAEHKQRVAHLLHENQLLSAQKKQLETTIAHSDHDKSDGNGKRVYEVGQLLDDKMKTVRVRHFLVRWKGFTAKDDTWERESNLMCPTLLEKYIEKKKNNEKSKSKN